MAIRRITEKTTSDVLETDAHILVTQSVVDNGQVIQDVRRVPIDKFGELYGIFSLQVYTDTDENGTRYLVLADNDGHEIARTEFAFNGAGGSTGNYNDQINKPQIAGITLIGNKSLSELGIGTYSKPVGGIPASDLASDVIPSVPDPSNATPQALGTAAAGSSGDYARADHVHAKPTAADVGAIPAPASATTGQFVQWDGSAWVAASLPVYNGGVH